MQFLAELFKARAETGERPLDVADGRLVEIDGTVEVEEEGVGAFEKLFFGHEGSLSRCVISAGAASAALQKAEVADDGGEPARGKFGQILQAEGIPAAKRHGRSGKR